MQEPYPQLHVEPDRVIHGRHPDPDVVARVERTMQEGEERITQFQELVDANNRNAQYQEFVTIVDRLFERDGLSHTPFAILTTSQFDEVLAIYAPGEQSGNFDGMLSMGRCVVHEHSHTDGSQAVRILGTMFHEGAHSSGTNLEDRGLISIATPSAADSTIEREYMHVPSEAGVLRCGFDKIRIRRKNGEFEAMPIASFLEEGFADYTRVYYMRELGIHLPPPDSPRPFYDDRLRLVDPMQMDLIPTPEGVIDIPADYADDEQLPIDAPMPVGDAAIAAYGIELLDRAAPGLYHTMQLARRDPKLQRYVIRMINSVQPGLYRKLRDLPESPDAFVAGLQMIYEAVMVRSRTWQGDTLATTAA